MLSTNRALTIRHFGCRPTKVALDLPPCRRPTAISIRSEERRVGKECRSLCDWSSDVCSSDLDALDKQGPYDPPFWVPPYQGRVGPPALPAADGHFDQIGRASCRERV